MDRLKNNKRIFIIVITLLAIFTSIYLFQGITSKNAAYFLTKRSTKIFTMMIVSICIGYSSLAFQTITNNQILTPSVMGLDSLYMFIQTVIVFMFGSKQLAMMDSTFHFILSVGLMVIASLLLFLTLFKSPDSNIYFLVLCGMVFGQLFSGLSTFMQVLLDPNEFDVLQGKMFASFSNVNTKLLLICSILTIVILIISYFDFNTLDVLSLGQKKAINLGVDYSKIVLKTLICISILISISTVLVGPITFLGILLVSLTRHLLNSYKHLHLALMSILLGMLFLIGGSYIVERVFQFTTTLSVILNFVGGSYFIYLMIRRVNHD